MEDVRNSVEHMLQYIRSHGHEDLELEFRIGQLDERGQFKAGYAEEDAIAVKRLEAALKIKVDRCSNWKAVAPYKMLKADFGNHLQQVAFEHGVGTIYQYKTAVETRDVLAHNRPISFRVRLSKEERVDLSKKPDIHAMVKQTQPLSVRLCLRHSFTETIALGEEEIMVRYDITRTTLPCKTKIEAFKAPAVFQVELELVSKLRPWSDKTLESDQNRAIAKALLARAVALLGSYAVESNEERKALQPPKIAILHGATSQ